MERDRRDSASSTDSWSIIENRSSRLVESSDEDALIVSGTLQIPFSDSEVEEAEEAFDSYDSDIEVRDYSEESESEHEDEDAEMSDREESEHEEEAVETAEETESDVEEESAETEEQMETDSGGEEQDNKAWYPVDQTDVGSDGLKYVPPENIKNSLDHLAEEVPEEVIDNRLFLYCYIIIASIVVVVQWMVLMYLAIDTSPTHVTFESTPAVKQSLSSGLQRPWEAKFPAFEQWKKQPKGVTKMPTPLPYFNATLLAEIRSLRFTRKVISGNTERTVHPLISVPRGVLPSSPLRVRPSLVLPPVPEFLNLTPSFQQDFLCPSVPSVIIPSFVPLISAESNKFLPFSYVPMPTKDSLFDGILQNLTSDWIDKWIGTIESTETPLIQEQSSVCDRRAPSAPLAPPSNVRHHASKAYRQVITPAKSYGHCKKNSPKPMVRISSIYGTSFKTEVTVSTSLNVVPTVAMARVQRPMTHLPKRTRRLVKNLMKSSNYSGLGHMVSTMDASSKASRLMRKQSPKAPRQCNKTEMKTKYTRFVPKKRRISYKQPLPCRASYNLETSLSSRKSSAVGHFSSKSSDNKSLLKRKSQKQRAQKKDKNIDWMFARSRARAQFRKV